jgi:hypothetical protein
MPKKKANKDAVQPLAAQTEPEELKPVTLRVSRKHIMTPHSIEIRRLGTERVVEVRTEDHRHIETMGAKTVLQILEENGAGTLLKTGDQQLEIAFSPLNGDIISILPFKGEDKPASGGKKKAGESDGKETTPGGDGTSGETNS